MKLRIFLLLVLFTTLFTIAIFFVRSYFFQGKEDLENKIIEEKYIDPVAPQDIKETSSTGTIQQVASNEELELNSATEKVVYTYIPKSLEKEREIKLYTSVLNMFLNYEPLEKKISLLDVVLTKPKGEVRGKMQDKKVKLFGVYEMVLSEFLAVSIHEFSHFYDLYILQKRNGIDVSDFFYEISWQDTKIIKPSLTKADFVSGYAMTNKYEDFAETFTYYTLHNSDFLEKTKKSDILKKKYDFFSTHIFTQKEFTSPLLESQNEIKDYYRDTTKIEYSLQNFLQYVKN